MSDVNCPLCCEDFATDPSAIQDQGASRLPLTCLKCCNYTLCCACLSDMYSRRLQGRSNLRYVTCPVCANPQGFDGRKHVIDRKHCRQLLRELGECVAPLPPPTSVPAPEPAPQQQQQQHSNPKEVDYGKDASAPSPQNFLSSNGVKSTVKWEKVEADSVSEELAARTQKRIRIDQLTEMKVEESLSDDRDHQTRAASKRRTPTFKDDDYSKDAGDEKDTKPTVAWVRQGADAYFHTVHLLSSNGVTSTVKWENGTIGEVEADLVSRELPPRRRQKRFEQSNKIKDEESLPDDRDHQKRAASKSRTPTFKDDDYSKDAGEEEVKTPTVAWVRQGADAYFHTVRLLSSNGVKSIVRWENGTIGEVEADLVSRELPPRRRQKRFEQSTKIKDEESLSDDRDHQKRAASKSHTPTQKKLKANPELLPRSSARKEKKAAPKTPPRPNTVELRRESAHGRSPTSVAHSLEFRVPEPIVAQRPATEGGVSRPQDGNSSWNLAVAVKLEESEEKNQRKDRGSMTVADLSPQRKERLNALINANIDQSTGGGRQVFLRGCAKKSLTTILGGSGIQPGPLLKKEPPTIGPTGNPNPFIKQGEVYLAGRDDFNPWGPSFPGDYGLVESRLLKNREAETEKGYRREEQESFHLFITCSKQRWDPHYHGNDVKGYRLYVGKYRRVPQDPDAEVIETSRHCFYKHLGDRSQWTMAYHYRQRSRIPASWTDNGIYYEATHDEMLEGNFMEKVKNSIGEEAWGNLSEVRQQTEGWRQMLIDITFKIEIVPVEFVEYDEDLYKALVECGAGARCTKTGRPYTVSIKPEDFIHMV